MTAAAHEPARHSKRTQAAPRKALLVFVVLALAAAVAGGVVRAARAQTPAAVDDDGTTVLAAATHRLTATTSVGVGTVRFTISSTTIPSTAVLALDPAGSAVVREVVVDLSSPSNDVILRGLASGVATWVLRSDGARTLRGDLTIAGKQDRPGPADGSAPSSSETAATGAAPAGAPSSDSGGTGTTPHPPATGGSAPAPAAPTPRPTPRPTQEPSPSPTPRPTGPATPYDPDDH